MIFISVTCKHRHSNIVIPVVGSQNLLLLEHPYPYGCSPQ